MGKRRCYGKIMIKSEIVERIGRMVDSKEEEIIDLLRNLVRFNTVNPPGNEKPLQEWLAKELISRGGYLTRTPTL